MRILFLTAVFVLGLEARAGAPLWTFTPLTATTLTVQTGTTATIQYNVTNQSSKAHTLAVTPITGITQITTTGNCASPFVLAGKQSCVLTLSVDGSQLTGNVTGGPVVCQTGSALQCYQPSSANALKITKTVSSLIAQATLTASASPDMMLFNDTAVLSTVGGSGLGIVTFAVTTGGTNCSLDGVQLTAIGVGTCQVTATKAGDSTYLPATSNPITLTINKTFQGALTAIATPSTISNGGTSSLSTTGGSGTGGVSFTVETGGANCSIVGATLTGTAAGSCTVSATKAADANYTPITSAPITVTVNPVTTLTLVSPSSGPTSGGTGVTLTGTGLTGTTSITFGGVAATSINVIDATTVTAVTPAHAAGMVDVVITTAGGSAPPLVNGFTYAATSVGQAAFGGTIACLNGGSNNLIASTSDISAAVLWGDGGTNTNATSTTDGATNTTTIVGTGGMPTPNASTLCDAFEVDSLGNTPCQVGNACYSDWFLPAGNNAGASGQLNCLYTNRVAIGGFAAANYWSSTEHDVSNAWLQSFANGLEATSHKSFTRRVRCVRAFTP